MKYCARCLYPETKPDLWFDADGLCSACLAYDARAQIDWRERELEFRELIKTYRNPNGYDCVVGVSGGKDSHYQILKCLEYGLNPLAVTAQTCYLTPIGRRNLDNISKLGVDHIEVKVKPGVRRAINRLALREIGDVSWPEHILIFTVPVRVALQYGIRLIVWGENSQNEYGGPQDAAGAKTLDRRWLEEFGGLLGLRVSDLLDQGLAARDLVQYTYPDLVGADLHGLFLGHYFPWDGEANGQRALNHGFEHSIDYVEGTLSLFGKMDNAFHGIHDRLKWLKYGFGRATDDACNLIRRGYRTRKACIPAVIENDGQAFHYAGVDYANILESLGITADEMHTLEQRFANPKLFDSNLRPLFRVGGNA